MQKITPFLWFNDNAESAQQRQSPRWPRDAGHVADEED